MLMTTTLLDVVYEGTEERADVEADKLTDAVMFMDSDGDVGGLVTEDHPGVPLAASEVSRLDSVIEGGLNVVFSF